MPFPVVIGQMSVYKRTDSLSSMASNRFGAGGGFREALPPEQSQASLHTRGVWAAHTVLHNTESGVVHAQSRTSPFSVVKGKEAMGAKYLRCFLQILFSDFSIRLKSQHMAGNFES